MALPKVWGCGGRQGMTGRVFGWLGIRNGVGLVETGTDGSSRSVDVMAIDCLGELGDIADLGLTRASSLWLWSNRQSSRAGTMPPDGRCVVPAEPRARSRITALTRSPLCSVRSCSGCPASAAPAAAGRRRLADTLPLDTRSGPGAVFRLPAVPGRRRHARTPSADRCRARPRNPARLHAQGWRGPAGRRSG
jgi:hypothetical protein